ncbi:MAG: hypothetical protein D6696_09010 [Acidobacteria bacterium]|nr:MAG: hypothetical protein D6696_09010 [Acidobacteriota bacterium]
MLWPPILVSTVLVFIASSLIWMVLRLHRNDWAKLPDEDALIEALRKQDPAPGEYSFPYAAGPEEWKSEEVQEKMKRGPAGFLTVVPPGLPNMAKNMGSWLLYIVVISIFVAYVASRTLPAGSDYLRVFQVAGTVAILAYAGAAAPAAIWMGRKWSNVFKDIFDGIVYGLLTAGSFGWLWPAG